MNAMASGSIGISGGSVRPTRTGLSGGRGTDRRTTAPCLGLALAAALGSWAAASVLVVKVLL
jgi:hypothetical protein